MTKTLITDPFEDDAVSILEWAYGYEAKQLYYHWRGLDQRVGQAFMNVLRRFDWPAYTRLTNSPEDPFYDDTMLPRAIDRITSK